MLFFTNRASELSVDGATRLHLLDRLQDRGFTPLIRASRLMSFEQALQGAERAKEMERAIAAWTETEENSLYVRGDLFSIEDHVFYLIFGGAEDDLAGMRAGIVYGRDTLDSERKLEAFCRRVSEALDAIRSTAVPREEASTASPEWKARENVVAIDDYTSQVTDDNAVEKRLALEALEDIQARRLLYRIEEAQAAGRVAELLANETENQSLINRLADVGLLKREVLVSCRKEGRALFRLPSIEMLTIITASNAMCSECGAALSDEKVEELVMLTEMARALLPDSTWLVNRLRTVLKEMGVPQKAIRLLPATGDGEVHMEVTVSDEPFLFVLRDGDLSTTNAARALDKLIDTEAQHLVVIVTGRVQEDARVRLREHARRRARGGNETEVVLIEGMDAAAGELQHAFERASQRALATELCELDASLGFSAGYMVATRFRLMQRSDALRDLAESAVGALAGSLREI
ncbi:MAG TPA: hypothetical protein VJS44_18260 [Pyrinomonadaceae bacterium]|nr:hypothetical protein [Pyrinomonadaceae bacterium]